MLEQCDSHSLGHSWQYLSTTVLVQTTILVEQVLWAIDIKQTKIPKSSAFDKKYHERSGRICSPPLLKWRSSPPRRSTRRLERRPPQARQNSSLASGLTDPHPTLLLPSRNQIEEPWVSITVAVDTQADKDRLQLRQQQQQQLLHLIRRSRWCRWRRIRGRRGSF